MVDDGQPDIEAYNEELKVLGFPKWFHVPWLYAECYLYRYRRRSILPQYNAEMAKIDA